MNRSHDWKRLIVQALGVTASILLAFAIDASWDQWQDRIEERQALIRLQQEFNTNHSRFIEARTSHQRILENAVALLAHIDTLRAEPLHAGGYGPETLEAVDLYGLRMVPEVQVQTAVGLTAGDPTPDSVEPIRARLLRIPGVAAVDVSIVCCGGTGGSLLYVGIREEGTPPTTFHSAPTGDAALSDEIVELGAQFRAALLQAVRRGDTAEDISQGYALSADSTARSVQQEFREVARADFDALVAVVRTSSNAAHRALAAQIIAYGPDRQAVVRELLHAVRDPSEGVRNNAARALALLAQWRGENAETRLSIPAAPFVDFLNSVTWTDRNKGVMVLVPLTADRDPALLSELRVHALPALVEMARWSNPGHALGPYIILARIAGLDDGEAFQAWEAGERERIIERAQTRARGPARPNPRPDTYRIANRRVKLARLASRSNCSTHRGAA